MWTQTAPYATAEFPFNPLKPVGETPKALTGCKQPTACLRQKQRQRDLRRTRRREGTGAPLWD